MVTKRGGGGRVEEDVLVQPLCTRRMANCKTVQAAWQKGGVSEVCDKKWSNRKRERKYDIRQRIARRKKLRPEKDLRDRETLERRTEEITPGRLRGRGVCFHKGRSNQVKTEKKVVGGRPGVKQKRAKRRGAGANEHYEKHVSGGNLKGGGRGSQ